VGAKGELTRKGIINAIKEFMDLHKYSPTIRDICDITGIKSTSTVHKNLEILKKQGYVEWDSTLLRTLRIV